MKHIRWTCDICNQDGIQADGFAFVATESGDFREAEERFGWVRRYDYQQRKVNKWPSIHVCPECTKKPCLDHSPS